MKLFYITDLNDGANSNQCIGISDTINGSKKLINQYFKEFDKNFKINREYELNRDGIKFQMNISHKNGISIVSVDELTLNELFKH